MAILELPVKVTSLEIERFYSTVKDSEIVNTNFVIPVKLNYRGFGILPSIILLFYRWLRINKNGNLIINTTINEQNEIKEFSSDFLGYTILLSAWKHAEIINSKKKSLKGDFRPYTQILHKKIDFLEGLPNDHLLIPLFDHYTKEQGLSHWLYDSNFKFVASPPALSNSIYRIFEELGKIYKTKINKNINESIDDLEVIIWELIKNTQEHAIKDYLNEIELSPNVRAVYFKIHRSSKNNFLKDAKDIKGLKNYFDSILNQGENFLLEISIFDSGPGMVKRFLGNEWSQTISANDEVNVIKKCLCKGTTSAEGFRGVNKGYGLNNVLITLSKRQGFLQIRTGRVSLYRDLLKSPHFEHADFNRIELQDTNTNSPSEFSVLGSATGTLITMFYPLK